MLQSLVGDVRVDQMQRLQLGQVLYRFEAFVRDRRAAEDQMSQGFEFDEATEPRVSHPRAGKEKRFKAA